MPVWRGPPRGGLPLMTAMPAGPRGGSPTTRRSGARPPVAKDGGATRVKPQIGPPRTRWGPLGRAVEGVSPVRTGVANAIQARNSPPASRKLPTARPTRTAPSGGRAVRGDEMICTTPSSRARSDAEMTTSGHDGRAVRPIALYAPHKTTQAALRRDTDPGEGPPPIRSGSGTPVPLRRPAPAQHGCLSTVLMPERRTDISVSKQRRTQPLRPAATPLVALCAALFVVFT